MTGGDPAWLVIDDPGRPGHRGRHRQVGAALRTAEVPFDLVDARPGAETDTAVAGAAGRGVRRFAAVGADRQVHILLNALLARTWDTPPTLAVLPVGAGSDFARTFALPADLGAAAHRLRTPDVYRTDVGRVEGRFGGRFFLNSLDTGIAAAALRLADRWPGREARGGWGAAWWLTLPWFPAASVEVTHRSRTFTRRALNVLVANGQFVGGGVNAAPRSAVMDGVLDLQVLSGPRRRAPGTLGRMRRGHHLGDPSVTRRRVTETVIRVPARWPVAADGELLGRGSVTVRIVPGAIDFKI